MTVIQALLAFSVAAALLTITPGLDTALVLRTAAVEGPKRAVLAAVGIVTGCLAVFYVSFLPQFLPPGAPVGPFIFLLAAMHAVMGLAWFAALIAATRPIAAVLRRAAVVRWLDRLTGGVFLAFGLKLALERR